MNVQHHAFHDRKPRRRSWLREEEILGVSAALLAFAVVYAYTGDADLYYAMAGAVGMGAVTYAGTYLQARRKSR